MIDRRRFAIGTTATAALLLLGQARDIVVRPEDHGARGDGRTDDTAALQAAADSVPPGGRLQLRAGAVYRVDTNANPTAAPYGGLRIGNGVTLDLNGAELRALPSAQPAGAVVQAYKTRGWRIIGPGRIVGERAVHRGTAGEWGQGIAAFSASGWTIGPEVEIAECWGDGIYVGGAMDEPGGFCEDFLISGVSIHHCRRNGISVVGGRNGIIRGATVRQISGTAPQAGIDLEPDSAAHPNRNIIIENVDIEGVQLGVGVAVANEQVRISGSRIVAENSGIVIADNTRNLEIVNNDRIANTHGGAEGAAIRTVASSGASIQDVRIRSNGLEGGGFYVLDLTHVGYRNVVIEGNRITASNRNALGVARILGGGTLRNNMAMVTPPAGMAGDPYLQLHHVELSGNRFENRTGLRLRGVVLGSRDSGGNVIATPGLIDHLVQ